MLVLNILKGLRVFQDMSTKNETLRTGGNATNGFNPRLETRNGLCHALDCKVPAGSACALNNNVQRHREGRRGGEGDESNEEGEGIQIEESLKDVDKTLARSVFDRIRGIFVVAAFSHLPTR